MIAVILLTLLFTLIFVGLMTVGVVFAGRPLQGSCGGNPEACLCKGALDRPETCAANLPVATEKSFPIWSPEPSRSAPRASSETP